MNWRGVWVALVTPFRSDKLDLAAFTKLIDRLIAAGVDGIIPAGTTGEGSALEDDEFATLVQKAMDVSAGRVPVVPGTGSNNTKHTIERTRIAKKLGAQGALVVTPYYVKPTSDGLVRHYSEVGKVGLPLFLYNVPGRTAVNMLPETVERIAKEAPVKAVKECAPLPQVAELIERVGDRIEILTGEDGLFLPFLGLGGHGIVSVAANLLPEKFVAIQRAFQASDLLLAQKEFLSLTRLIQCLFVEGNPLPIKEALSFRGEMSNETRSPLAPMSKQNSLMLREEMKRLQLVMD